MRVGQRLATLAFILIAVGFVFSALSFASSGDYVVLV